MTMSLFRAYPESNRPFTILIRESNSLLNSYLKEKSSLSFLFNIVRLALNNYVLAGSSRHQVLNLCGGIVPSDFCIRTVRSRHVPYCVRRRQYMKTAYVGRQYMLLIFASFFSRGPISQLNRETFSERSAKNGCS